MGTWQGTERVKIHTQDIHRNAFLEQRTVQGECLKFSTFTTYVTPVFLILHGRDTTEHVTMPHREAIQYITYIRVCKNASSKSKGRCRDGAVRTCKVWQNHLAKKP